MSLSNPSQQGCWDRLALFGVHGKSSKLGWNAYDGYLFAKGSARVLVVLDGEPTGEVKPAPRRGPARRADKRRGIAADGSALPGWRLLRPGLATWVG